MPITVKFRLIQHTDRGLRNAPVILAREFKGTLRGIGQRLTRSAAIRMRSDTGQEIKSLKSVVSGKGLDYSLTVYSTLLKAFIDAYGLRPGVQMPFGFGTRIYSWAERRVRNQPNREVRDSFDVPHPHSPRREFQRGGLVKRVRSIRHKRVTEVKGPVNLKGRSRNLATRRLAFLTARAVFQRGIRATHWNRETLIANRARIIRDLKNAMSRAANKINRG